MFFVFFARKLLIYYQKYFKCKCKFRNQEKNIFSRFKILFVQSDNFHISAQNIDCGYEAVSTSTTIYVLSRNNENNVYPCKPQFYYIKVGFKGCHNYIGMAS